MQISIDGVHANDTTQKVLTNLRKRLEWLRIHARFRVIVSGVLGATPSQEAEEVVSFAQEMGFTPRVLLVHDNHGQLKLNTEEVKTFEKIVAKLPKTWVDLTIRVLPASRSRRWQPPHGHRDWPKHRLRAVRRGGWPSPERHTVALDTEVREIQGAFSGCV